MQTLAHRRSLGIAGVLLLLASLFHGDGSGRRPPRRLSTEQHGPTGRADRSPRAFGLEHLGLRRLGHPDSSVVLNAGYTLELCVKGGPALLIYTVTAGWRALTPPADCRSGQCPMRNAPSLGRLST